MIIADNSLQETNCDIGLHKEASFNSHYHAISEIIKDYNHEPENGVKAATKEKISSKSYNKFKEECNPIIVNQIDGSGSSFSSESKAVCSCRICLEEIIATDLITYNQSNKTNQMILPCLCKGTAGYCHQMCLKNWISVNFTDYANASCEICKLAFRLIFIKGEITIEDKRKIIKNLLILFLFQIVLNILIYLVLYKAEFNSKVTATTSALIFIGLNVVGFVSISLLMQKEYRFWREGRVIDYTIANLQEL